MKIHIQGICGTFMGGIALLARSLGHEVQGSDANVYPPMSTQLTEQGITLLTGYAANNLDPAPDLVIVGNVMTRGNPELEALLNSNIPYLSGPEWLLHEILQHRRVLAVSGTHGKTTTTSMLAWVLTVAGYRPGFLIGGVPENFGVSATLGQDYFVIEADEYDTAFFDKRSKFIHYRPEVAILNNIEFDHADIFPDLASIFQQFQYFIRVTKGKGRLVVNDADPNIPTVLAKGTWTPCDYFLSERGWQFKALTPEVSNFEVFYQGKLQATVQWSLVGAHNASNALAVFSAAQAVGIEPKQVAEALATFKNVKRRLELLGERRGVKVYDDFAHHPTAIQKTVEALRKAIGPARLIAILEFGSNTMKSGHYTPEQFVAALEPADHVIFKAPNFDLQPLLKLLGKKAAMLSGVEEIVPFVQQLAKPGDHVLIMSNKSFEGIHRKLLEALA